MSAKLLAVLSTVLGIIVLGLSIDVIRINVMKDRIEKTLKKAVKAAVKELPGAEKKLPDAGSAVATAIDVCGKDGIAMGSNDVIVDFENKRIVVKKNVNVPLYFSRILGKANFKISCAEEGSRP